MATITTLNVLDSGATSRTTINTNFSNLNATSGTWSKETPQGVFDGSNTTYTLNATPIANSVMLYVNGIAWVENTDYTISGSSLTLTTPLPAGFAGSFRIHFQY